MPAFFKYAGDCCAADPNGLSAEYVCAPSGAIQKVDTTITAIKVRQKLISFLRYALQPNLRRYCGNGCSITVLPVLADSRAASRICITTMFVPSDVRSPSRLRSPRSN